MSHIFSYHFDIPTGNIIFGAIRYNDHHCQQRQT